MYPIPSWMAPFRVDEVVCGESRWRQGPQGLSVQRPLRHVPHRGHPAASRARIRQGNSRLPSRALRATATQSRGRHGRKWIRGCRGSEGQLLIMGTSRVFFGDGSTALTAEHFKKATKEGTAYLSKALTAAATGGWGVGGGAGGGPRPLGTGRACRLATHNSPLVTFLYVVSPDASTPRWPSFFPWPGPGCPVTEGAWGTGSETS